MEGFSGKMRRLDEKYKDLPRKACLVAAVFGTAFISLKLLPFLWPFVLGYVFSLLMRPLTRPFSKLFSRLKRPERPATLLAMLIVYGVIAFVVILLFKQMFVEGEKLVKNIPGIISWVQTTMKGWIERYVPDVMEAQQEVIYNRIDQITTTLIDAMQGLLSKATPVVASGAWSTVTGLPHAILFLVMTVMSSFYFASDSGVIRAYLIKLMPESVITRFDSLSLSIGQAVIQQIKAQILISCALMVALVIGFTVFQIEYALLLGVVIGALDVLPVIGAGTFLIPWGLFNLFANNISLGVRILGMYVIVVLIRQIIEPRIVGKKLGLYPLITMLSIYVGLRLMGFIGLIAGPVAANICKVVLTGDAEIRAEQRRQEALKG